MVILTISWNPPVTDLARSIPRLDQPFAVRVSSGPVSRCDRNRCVRAFPSAHSYRVPHGEIKENLRLNLTLNNHGRRFDRRYIPNSVRWFAIGMVVYVVHPIKISMLAQYELCDG